MTVQLPSFIPLLFLLPSSILVGEFDYLKNFVVFLITKSSRIEFHGVEAYKSRTENHTNPQTSQRATWLPCWINLTSLRSPVQDPPRAGVSTLPRKVEMIADMFTRQKAKTMPGNSYQKDQYLKLEF